ncbi:MAG: glycerophosphodiester phosphodiesterase family protein [Clostridia bacterium]|nr:glycerophosphodiester phosphodiesterase family protein [Clostridia bacterium]
MNLLEMAKKKKVLLVAHRGVCGGNIPCNSLQAFQIALNQGADIVELDVDNTKDGELFIQHPKMEKVHLRMQDRIRAFPGSVVENFKLSNCDLTPTEWNIVRLEDALKLMKGKCIINIDKFWENPEKISKLIRKLGMEDQILIKTANKPEYLDAVEKYAPDLYYMSVVTDVDTTHEQMKKRNINYVGAEVLFKSEDAAVASKEYIDMMHSEGKIVWVNALVYDYHAVLAAYHNDDVSMVESPEKGWGWLADRGFDLIQTDFLLPCKQFLENTGRRNK